jgi:Ca2+-binding RTX toxin-like protein
VDGIVATQFGDSLFGFGGNDILDGGGGDDRMFGGADADSYYVDSIGDIVREDDWLGRDEGGTDKVFSSVSYVLGNYVENLALRGSGDIDATGNALENTLQGNAGKNAISGYAMADMLIGGLGADRLDGGGGADTFVYKKTTDSTTAAVGRDQIINFRHGQGDTLLLTAIDADTTRKGNQDFEYIGSDRFSHAAAELRVSYDSYGFTISGDVTGDGRADFAIHFDETSRFRASDLVL